MCQILFSTAANPPKEVMEYANDSNPHGFGFAWVDGDKVRWQKGYDKEDLTSELIEQYNALPFPKAIHFRWGTHGGINKEMTHPFPIKRGVPLSLVGTAQSVLFHNGVWHSYDDRLRDAIIAGTINPNILKEGMSDSRAMAVLCQRFGEDFLDLLDINNQKVLILRHDTWYTYGSWSKEGGWSASNPKVKPSSSIVIRDHRNQNFVTVRDATTGEKKSMYLDASKAEIEASAEEWGRRGLFE